MDQPNKTALYYLVQCPCCSGLGRVPAKFDSYRIVEEYQDETQLRSDKLTLRQARAIVRKGRRILGAFAPNYTIIAPNGKVVE